MKDSRPNIDAQVIMEWVVTPLVTAIGLVPLALLVLGLATPFSLFILGIVWGLGSLVSFLASSLIYGLSVLFSEPPLFGRFEVIEATFFPFAFTAVHLCFAEKMLREYTRLRSYRGLYLPFTIFISVIISMLIPVEAYDAGPDVAITNVLLASSAIGIWVAVYFYLLDLK